MHTDKLVGGTNEFRVFLPFFDLCRYIFLLFHDTIKEKLIYKDFVLE